MTVKRGDWLQTPAGKSLEQQIIGSLADVEGTSDSAILNQVSSWKASILGKSKRPDWSAWLVMKCLCCPTLFVRRLCDVKKAAGRGHFDMYCGKSCSQAHHATKNSRMCEVCGDPVGRKTGRTLCRGCFTSAHLSRRSSPKRACGECGMWFWPLSTRREFCSKQCADSVHSRRMVGHGNPRYKDGSSYAEWFRLMRPIVLERDRNSCVVCDAAHELIEDSRGVMRNNLHIHHVDENPRNNRAENLVALCKSCHITHHKKTPFAWLSEYAVSASASMTSKLKDAATSLQTKFSSTTAS